MAAVHSSFPLHRIKGLHIYLSNNHSRTRIDTSKLYGRAWRTWTNKNIFRHHHKQKSPYNLSSLFRIKRNKKKRTQKMLSMLLRFGKNKLTEQNVIFLSFFSFFFLLHVALCHLFSLGGCCTHTDQHLLRSWDPKAVLSLGTYSFSYRQSSHPVNL